MMNMVTRIRSFNPSMLIKLIVSRTGVLALTAGGTLVSRTISSIILTRLLSPQDFGISGIVSSIFFAIGMLTDLGFQAFIIRHEHGDDQRFLNVIWTIHATRGMMLTLFAMAVSPFIAWFMLKPELALPLAVCSIIFALNGFTSLSLITALRTDGARKLSLFEFGLQVFQIFSCILLALWLKNSWALILSVPLYQGTRALLSYVLFKNSKQSFARDPDISRDFFKFSRIVMATSSLALLIGQSDKLVLGRLFTLDQYGLYAIAFNLASAPTAFSSAFVTRILYPICARTWRENPSELSYVYYRVRRLPLLIYGLGCGGLIGGAGLLIAILYDPRYAPVAFYLALLAISTALSFPNLAAADTMTAIGEVKVTLHCNLVRVGWLLTAGPVSYLLFGAIGLVATVGLLEVPALFYNWIVLRRAHLLKLREEFLFLGVVLAGAILGSAVAATAFRLFPHL